MDGRVDVAQECGGPGRRRRRRAADEPGDRLGRRGWIPRAHPLGCEGEVEVAAGHEPRSLELRPERAHRRARERRRLEDDELARAKRRCDQAGGRDHRPEVGILGFGDRGRHAHEDRIGRGEIRVPHGDDAQAALETAPEPLVVDVVDRRAALAQLFDPPRRRVDAHDIEAGLEERQGQRQADVAEADHGDAGISAHDPSCGVRAEDSPSRASRSTSPR